MTAPVPGGGSAWMEAVRPDSTRYATRGAVCTVDHLASAAGVALLRAGGNAVDAAVGASAVLAVTTQQSCGAGGDLLAVVRLPDGSVRSLLGIGRAGSGSDAARLREEGHVRMPFRGDVRTVTVPGCVDGWVELHDALGRLPLGDVLAPAVHYAESGFPASPLLAAAAPTVFGVAGLEELEGVRAGQVVRRPRLARALRDVGTDGRCAWYEGAFGDGLLALGRGLFTADDLRRRQAEWAAPARLDVGGRTLLSTAAPTQGYLVLASAWVAEEIGAWGDPHLLVEAARTTGHDRLERLADGADVEELLRDLPARAARVHADRALDLRVPVEGGGTIYLCTADADGLVVSLSQSNAAGFGSGLAEPTTGVALHNRGIGFSLAPGHPAELRPGARPVHTLCPSLVVDGDRVAAVGTMGGDAQPQIVLQLLDGLRSGLTPAQALDRPRWSLVGPRQDGFDQWEPWPDGAVTPGVALEPDAPVAWEERLRAAGHRVERQQRGFGHAHCVVRRSDGVLAAASDPRAGVGDAQGW